MKYPNIFDAVRRVQTMPRDTEEQRRQRARVLGAELRRQYQEYRKSRA